MKRDSDILCGGVTDRTDKNAPDKILSKDLTGFYANFFLSTRCTRDQRHNFCFSIKQTDGTLTAWDEILMSLQSATEFIKSPQGSPPSISHAPFLLSMPREKSLALQQTTIPLQNGQRICTPCFAAGLMTGALIPLCLPVRLHK